MLSLLSSQEENDGDEPSQAIANISFSGMLTQVACALEFFGMKSNLPGDNLGEAVRTEAVLSTRTRRAK